MSAASIEKSPDLLQVKMLSRFLRATFGVQASAEARRRQAVWRESANGDIAEIWGCVAKTLLTAHENPTQER